MTSDSPEVFDDLYLGLRAGGAMRKQRRGEALTAEEQEVLGRWQEFVGSGELLRNVEDKVGRIRDRLISAPPRRAATRRGCP